MIVIIACFVVIVCGNVPYNWVIILQSVKIQKREISGMNKELVIGTLQCIFFALVCYFIILIFH